jgi:predicted nucleic acid-binding protein
LRLVLDASVAVAAVRPKEPNYVAARTRVEGVLTGHDELIVPALFPIEVASALARRAAWPQAQIRRYIDGLLPAPSRVVTIGPKRANAAARLATATKLRAADAVYVWLAAREGVPLITADGEVVDRGAAVCQIEMP